MMTKKEKKRVPGLRFEGFEGEWEEKKIGSLGDFNGGGTPDSGNKDFWDGDIPWISSSDISDDSIHQINKTRFITLEAIKQSATKVITKGSVLMVSRVGIGKFAVADEDLCTSQDFTNLSTKENSYFIAYYFKARENLFIRLSQGTSIKGFTTKDIKAAKFPIPTISEQQKIATFLTSIDTRIQQLEKKKTLLEEYKKGVMQKIFSQEIRFRDQNGKEFGKWEEKRLGDVAIKKSSNIATNKIEDNFGEYIIYGAPGILKRVDFYEEENDYISIVKDGAGVGRVLYCEGKSSVLATLDMIKPKKGLNTYFLYCLLENINFVKYVTGSTIPHIYFKDYKKELIAVPTLPEQTKIAQFLSALDRKIAVMDGQIEKTKEWKKGLLQRMFV